MRVIVFFDLPNITLEEKRQYRKFRTFLLKEGFMMMQESVYSKIALNQTVVGTIKSRVIKNSPNSGIVQMIAITEKQYQSMEFVVGEKNSELIDNDKEVLLL